MLLTDWVLILSLLAFCVAWLAWQASWRKPVLWLSVTAALLSGAYGFLTYRWQTEVGIAVAVLFLLVLIVGALRSKQKQKLPWFSGSLFVLLSLASAAALWMFPVFELPEPGGPHDVGVVDFELTDHSRHGLQEAPDDHPRRFRVRTWYPAGDVSGLAPRPYFTKAEVEVTARSLGAQFPGPLKALMTHLALVDTHSYEGAEPLEAARPWPVVIYSHGYGLHYGQHTALMEHLASNGYLVFSIHHSYDGAAIRFDDGLIEQMDIEALRRRLEEAAEDQQQGMSENQLNAFAGKTWDDRYAGVLGNLADMEAEESRIWVSVDIWRDDQMFLLAEVAAGRVPEKLADITGRGDYSRVVHMGMSFGGSTAASTCQANPWCVAAVNLDGGNQDKSLVNKDVPAPFLMMQNDFVRSLASMVPEGWEMDPEYGFNDLSYERFETAGQRDDVYRLRVLGSTHGGYSDLGPMVRPPLKAPLFGTIDGYEMIAIQNNVVLGFLDKHVRGKQNGFPSAIYSQHPAIVEMSTAPVREWWLSRQ